MDDKMLQHFHSRYEYVLCIPLRDDFLLPFHRHHQTHRHLLINTNQFLYVGCNTEQSSTHRTAITNHTNKTTSSLSIDADKGLNLPTQCGVVYSVTTPYSTQLIKAALILLCGIRDQKLSVEDCNSSLSLLLLKNNPFLQVHAHHTPFLLTVLFGASQLLTQQIFQGLIRLDPLPCTGFFQDIAVFSRKNSHSESSPSLQRPELTNHEDHTRRIIHDLIDNTSSLSPSLEALQHRYNFTRGASTAYKRSPNTLFTHFSTKALIPKYRLLDLSDETERDYQIHSSLPMHKPLVSQAIPLGYCSAYTPTLLAQKYAHNKTHNWTPISANPPQTGIVLDTVTGKITIQGTGFTSKQLPSQKGLIEILTILLKAQSHVHNKDLPSSSYSKNRNTFESKIALPFNKLLKTFGYQNTAIRSSGSLYDFTTQLIQDDVEITIIKKP